MKKAIIYTLSAIIGICAGIYIHSTFMIVEAQGCMMLPAIEPEEKVLVCLRDKDIDQGDIVAVYSPYYTLDGEGKIIFRRVIQADEKGFVLTSDADLIQDEQLLLSKDELIGKVLVSW